MFVHKTFHRDVLRLHFIDIQREAKNFNSRAEEWIGKPPRCTCPAALTYPVLGQCLLDQDNYNKTSYRRRQRLVAAWPGQWPVSPGCTRMAGIAMTAINYFMIQTSDSQWFRVNEGEEIEDCFNGTRIDWRLDWNVRSGVTSKKKKKRVGAEDSSSITSRWLKYNFSNKMNRHFIICLCQAAMEDKGSSSRFTSNRSHKWRTRPRTGIPFEYQLTARQLRIYYSVTQIWLQDTVHNGYHDIHGGLRRRHDKTRSSGCISLAVKELQLTSFYSHAGNEIGF